MTSFLELGNISKTSCIILRKRGPLAHTEMNNPPSPSPLPVDKVEIFSDSTAEPLIGLTCVWTVGWNRRTWWKPAWAQGEHTYTFPFWNRPQLSSTHSTVCFKPGPLFAVRWHFWPTKGQNDTLHLTLKLRLIGIYLTPMQWQNTSTDLTKWA